MDRASFSYRCGAALKSALGYGALCGKHFQTSLLHDRKENDLNRNLVGYPHNHNYSIRKKVLFPGFQLYERARLVAPLIPEGCASFLDIGSCKGYYVLKAATERRCRIAAGIDIHAPFIAASQQVAGYLGAGNARFYLSDIEQVSHKPEDFGGPFQAVLLIGTYQYLFWGSGLSMKAYYSHREILARLSRICTERLIFSARLEAGWLSSGIKEKACLLRNKIAYDTAGFLKAAGEFFQVKKAGYLGKYPLFLMLKK